MKKLLLFCMIAVSVLFTSPVHADARNDRLECVKNIADSCDLRSIFTETTVYQDCNDHRQTSEFDNRPYMIARFTVDSCNVNVAVFDCNGMNYEQGQAFTDAEDSSCMRTYGSQRFIGDHNFQGFDRLYAAKPYETRAVWNTRDEITNFICVESAKGTNITSDLLDANGVSLIKREMPGIITYTCFDETGRDIWYCVWLPE